MIIYNIFGGDLMELGKIIYAKRKEKGLSQEQLAEVIGVARSDCKQMGNWRNVPGCGKSAKTCFISGIFH